MNCEENGLFCRAFAGYLSAVKRRRFQLTRFALPVLFCGFLAGCICVASRAADIATNAPARLVIVKAIYGDPNNADSSADVTKQLAAAVKDDAVTIGVNNDNFEDMASGVSKRLKVDYTIDGVAGTKCGYEHGILKLSLKDKPNVTRNQKPARLIVHKALYGDLPDGDSNDVTSEVAKLVNDDTLTVKPNSDDFGDPAVGMTKKLRVDYTFDGKEKSKTAEEGQTLTISASGD